MPIAHMYEDYIHNISQGAPSGDVLDDLGMHRMCCRRMFLTHPHALMYDISPLNHGRDANFGSYHLQRHSSTKRRYKLHERMR